MEKQKALPRWRSHKVVEGFRIQWWETTNSGELVLFGWDGDRYLKAEVSAAYVEKHTPRVGGYFVRYEDGYESFSPAAAFEGGYTSVDAELAGEVNADLENEPDRDAMGERTSGW